VILAAALTVAALGASTAYACSGAEPQQIKTPEEVVSAASFTIPKFGRTEQARHYFAAMTEGDRNALAVLDEVIEQAKLTPQSESSHLADLHRERNLRAARLRAYAEAMRALPR